MVVQAHPKTKIGQLIEKLNKFYDTGIFTEFDLKWLKNEAEKIKDNIDVAYGFSLSGMIAFLENDTDKMHKFFEIALQQSGNAPVFLCQYAKALSNAGLHEKAYEYALKAYDKYLSDAETIDFLVNIVCILNEKDEFIKYTARWREITKEEHPLTVTPKLGKSDRKAVTIFTDENPDVSAVLEKSGPALIKYFGAPLTVMLTLIPDEDGTPDLVAYVRYHYDIEEGMKIFDEFEDWYISQGLDFETDNLVFDIMFV